MWRFIPLSKIFVYFFQFLRFIFLRSKLYLVKNKPKVFAVEVGTGGTANVESSTFSCIHRCFEGHFISVNAIKRTVRNDDK